MWFSNVTSISSSFATMFPEIKKIVFVGNRFEKIYSKFFQGMVNLESIVAIKMVNPWDVILSDTFENLKNLKSMDLRQNMIVKIEVDSFSTLGNLSRISFNDNKLESLPRGLFKNNKMLQQINLRNNRLKSIPSNLFDHLNNIHINLENNYCVDVKEESQRIKKYLQSCDLQHQRFYYNVVFRVFFGDWRF